MARAGARTRIVVDVGPIQVIAAAVDGFDEEVEAVEGVQLEVAEHLVEQRKIDVDSRPIVFKAKLERVVDLGLELQVVSGCDKTLAALLSRAHANRAATG